MPVLAAERGGLALAGRVPRARTRGARLVHAPYLLIGGTLAFNPVLAFVNGNVTSLTSGFVIAAEVLLVGAAAVLAATNFRPAMRMPTALIAWLFLFMVLRSAVVDPATSVKYFRDLLIAPVFLMLGMCTDRRYLGRYFFLLHTAVVAIALVEAFHVDLYTQLFHVKDYFIATRGLTEADFWNTDSDLFVSAARPDARFLGIFDGLMDAHRVSSLFLEPVSLGGYCVIVTGYLFARWRSLNLASRGYLIATNTFLMVACDGRLAIVSFAVIAVISAFRRLFPPFTPVLYLPGVLALAFAFVAATQHSGGGDDFPGRVAWTVDLLNGYDLPAFLGMSEEFMSKAVDSGVGYIVTTQSIFGMVLFWCLCGFSSRYETREQVVYAHALCLYVAFNALVSYGFLSIKTAALLWLIKGVFEAETEEGAPRAARPLSGAASPAPLIAPRARRGALRGT